ncbi:M15 family metallopeptidase [Myceligenerans crystallogenes]|uniref:D-alanyl-D-alanine carboxypeptidase-like core domain-containing protein n=1 Tax=Myceligenerans crystallogenes TaxID=316335 RepID=A0ABN2N598_9MICO
MEPPAGTGLQPGYPTRRARREALERAQGTRRVSRPVRKVRGSGAERTAPAQRFLSRTAVLGTLAAATIGVPLGQQAERSGESPFEVEAAPTGPSPLDLVTEPETAPRASENVMAAAPLERTGRQAVSREAERGPLPDCDFDAPVEGGNGLLADHSLCELWQDQEFLRPDAAVSLSALNEAFRTAFGRDLCLVASYRDLETQYAVKAARGFWAASPGTSMHGWGLAIDLCSQETGNSEVYSWLWANAPAYGWQNPAWAQVGGEKYEPWHWEYVAGVQELGLWEG